MTKRPIEFRAWDKRHKQMIEIDDLFWFEQNGVHNFNDGNVTSGDYVFLRPTGLLDKNGTKIFEGDILVHSGLPDKVFGVVTFESGAFVVKGIIDERGNDSSFIYNLSEVFIEVIGNTYENPELIK